VRVRQAALLAFIVALTFTGSAASTHTDSAVFAGRYVLDPNGRPGVLELTLVDAATGREAFRRGIAVVSPDIDCSRAGTQWYAGIYTTPNDRGPVAGCWPGGARDLQAYFKSLNFGGKVGYLEIPAPQNRAVYRAAATAVGDYSPPYQFFDLQIRWDRHFAGDGAGVESTTKLGPHPIKRGRVTVPIVSGVFAARILEVANGTVLTICNKETAFWGPDSFPKTGPNAFRVRLKPGACFSKKLVNTGTKAITVKVFDEIHSQAKLIIVISRPGA
jgi:hypothetical protein